MRRNPHSPCAAFYFFANTPFCNQNLGSMVLRSLAQTFRPPENRLRSPTHSEPKKEFLVIPVSVPKNAIVSPWKSPAARYFNQNEFAAVSLSNLDNESMNAKLMLKDGLRNVFGEQRARRLINSIQGRGTPFLETDLIREHFSGRRPGTMVDVGGHTGESFQEYLHDGWRIIAFEPDPKNRAQMAKMGWDLSKVKLRTDAISDQEIQNAAFFSSDESTGISSLSAFRPTHREAARVNVTTLTKALREESVTDVDFLKIDTEGHDLFALRGFPWPTMKPEVVLCEFEDSKSIPLGYDHRAMGDLLLQQGYTVLLSEWMPIARYGVQHEWRTLNKYPAPLQDVKSWGNFIAFRAGSDLRKVAKYLADYSLNWKL